VPSIAAVQPLHVAAWIELQTRERAAPSVKQQLAAIRHLFDWLVMGQVIPTNPAASVRGPSHVVRQGKTPVLDPAEARALLDAIDATTPIGLRDRALIALMIYSFARIGAALAMKVEDVFVQNRRLWVRLREKGGKARAMPCHHSLEEYLTALVHLADRGRVGPSPELLCDDPLNADRFRPSSRQHPVQDRRADGRLGLLGSEAAGSQPGSDQRLVATHGRFY